MNNFNELQFLVTIGVQHLVALVIALVTLWSLAARNGDVRTLCRLVLGAVAVTGLVFSCYLGLQAFEAAREQIWADAPALTKAEVSERLRSLRMCALCCGFAVGGAAVGAILAAILVAVRQRKEQRSAE